MSPRGLRRFTGALQFTVLLVVLLASAPLAQAQVDGTARAPASGRTSTSQLPTLGDGSGLGAGAERSLGDRIAREICRDPDYLDDPVLVENVDATWQSLLAAARSRGDGSPELDEQFSWEIMLGRDRTINAFALPGGNLGLHLGLNGEVTSRDELGSVLAHALSHATRRHISRLMSKQSAQAPWVVGAMIPGALAAGKSPESANAVIAGRQAGFAPQGLTTMFDKLQQAERLSDFGATPASLDQLLELTRALPAAARLTPLLADVLPLQSGQAGAILSGAGRAELFLNSQNLVRAGLAGEAIADLHIWLARHPGGASARQRLAGARAAQGLSLRAIRAEAEAQVARMDYAAALDRFKAAQTLMRNGQSASIDPIEASIIDNRARAVQSLHRAAEASP
jgi:predicted Zn-dependent protease